MTACRDCTRCTESPFKRFFRVLFNIGTLGIVALIAGIRRSFQQTCRVCGHPLSLHTIIDGRFKD
jgi:hypothetical protein